MSRGKPTQLRLTDAQLAALAAPWNIGFAVDIAGNELRQLLRADLLELVNGDYFRTAAGRMAWRQSQAGNVSVEDRFGDGFRSALEAAARWLEDEGEPHLAEEVRHLAVPGDDP